MASLEKLVLLGLLSLDFLVLPLKNINKGTKDRSSIIEKVDTLRIPQDNLELYRAWESYGIVVYKLDRKLELYNQGQLIRVYSPIGLGPNPIDPKTRKGDGCTPEGRFYICAKK